MRMNALWLSSALLFACGGGGGGDGDDADAGTAADAAPAGPQLIVELGGYTTTFSHNDDLLGITPSEMVLGINRVSLRRDGGDEAPLVLFDLGTQPVEVSLTGDSPALVRSVTLADLTAGGYQQALLSISHLRYAVPAVLHRGNEATDGEVVVAQVLAPEVQLEGTLREAGYRRVAFRSEGADDVTLSIRALPELATPRTALLQVVGGDAGPQLSFPLSVVVNPRARADVTYTFELNVFEALRYDDEEGGGFERQVFDVSTSDTEPVTRIGPNTFRFAE